MGSVPPADDMNARHAMMKMRPGALIAITMRAPTDPVQATLFGMEWITEASRGHMKTREDRQRFNAHHEAMRLTSIHSYGFADGSVIRQSGTRWEAYRNLAALEDSPLGGCPSFRDRLRHKIRCLIHSMFFELDRVELAESIARANGECPWNLPVEYVVDPD